MKDVRLKSTAGARPRRPRYAEVSDKLLARIQAGEITIGDMLPTEAELVDFYQVSRNTVREALRGLAQMGLIERRPGAGTTLIAAKPQRRYDQVSRTVDDLLQYGNTTHLVIDSAVPGVLGEKLSRELDLEIGGDVVHLRGRRFEHGQKSPLCFTDIYMLPQSKKEETQLLDLKEAVYVIIKLLAPKAIRQVDQVLDAKNLSADEAKALGVAKGTAALRALRRYTDKKGRCIAVAISLHPKDRFRYHSVLTHRAAK